MVCAKSWVDLYSLVFSKHSKVPTIVAVPFDDTWTGHSRARVLRVDVIFVAGSVAKVLRHVWSRAFVLLLTAVADQSLDFNRTSLCF